MCSEMLEVKLGFLERVVDDLEDQLKLVRDENALLLKRALRAEFRIQDHHENKKNPDIFDERLWYGK